MTRTRLLDLDDAPTLLEIARADRDFLAPWEPRRDERWLTPEGQREEVRSAADGRGHASAAVGRMVRTAFEELGLHRVEAGTLVHNAGSQRVLARNGFTRYGLAPSYLRIAGRWQDHELFQPLDPAVP
ncbi:Acetyltransferase (GNAT) domain-containing protein [Geodermatophilus dictyosporus]|uniref:Acetyltransferase (GNAT) domain-containing protein n=1 Tax=Geodermatophilus dictyosporus TaxID=1523247 RepID=A0A1I5TVS0_9ACTN|nr:GNAT family protein [Geodermatophilus dictyosporus]SFP87133.1 Acetyltransferase (GNAT) domain-containing protein [Geodermatophilus dictyosporus]